MTEPSPHLDYLDEALFHAATRGHTQIAKQLIALGADLHAREEEALRRAAFEGHKDTFAELCRAGADVGKAVCFAARAGQEQTVRQIMEFAPSATIVTTLRKAVTIQLDRPMVPKDQASKPPGP